MHIDQRKEQFSRAYGLAVAAGADYAWYQPNVDEDRIDLGVGEKGGGGTVGSIPMKVEIRDAEAMRMLRPMDVAAYLRSRGWTQRPASARQSTIWTVRCGEEEFEALLPLEASVGDFALRMGDIV